MAADIAILSDAGIDASVPLFESLAGVGFACVWAPTPSELQRELASGRTIAADRLLVVVDVTIGKSSAAAIERCARQRHLRRVSRPGVVLAYQAHTLTKIARPALIGCDTLSILERPLATAELRAAAVELRLSSRPFGGQAFR